MSNISPAPASPGDPSSHAVDSDAGRPAVRVEHVTKTYGSVKALDDVGIVLRKGTVHALVGENGSGKSTLTKVIAGSVEPDDGRIWIDGEELPHVNPREAIARGVRVIYQDLALFPNMTVADNIGFEGGRGLLRPVPAADDRRKAADALGKLGLAIDPGARLGDLSTAERQLVAIARAVSSNASVILMDEPTAALTQGEIDSLLVAVRGLARDGVSFIFISHKLREVIEIADDVTVIRDGRLVASGPAAEFDQERISLLMTGAAVSNVHRTQVPAADQPVLEVKGFSLGTTFTDIDLALYPGRILGLSGLVGCGKIEIGRAIAGLIEPERGTLALHGAPVRTMRGRRNLQYVPDDRLTEGLYLDWSIADNIVTNDLVDVKGKGGLVSLSRIRRLGEKWRDRLTIKTPSVDAPASSLSGGNQQRVLLARALAPAPEIVLLNNPTVGVDIGSRAEIHDLVRDVADDDCAVLLISDEPAEIMALCDDVAFVIEGRITEVHPVEELTEERIIDINGGGSAA